MVVFVLMLFSPYEGHTLLGVYSTREQAEAASDLAKCAVPSWAKEDWDKIEVFEERLDAGPWCPVKGHCTKWERATAPAAPPASP